MFRRFALLGVLAAVIWAGDGLWGQDEKVKTKRGLPTYWTKLGLSDEQKQKVYAIQADYGNKIDALQQQVKTLQKQERLDLDKVLTDPQKARLREIVTSKLPADPSGKDEKKPDEKKPDEKKKQ